MSRDKYDDYDPAPPRDPPGASGKAVASLVLGLASFLLLCLAGVPAIILGIMGVHEAARRPGRVGGRGLAVTGIVLGSLGTAATFVVVPVAIAIGLIVPTIRRAEARVQAMSGRLHTVNKFTQVALALQNYDSAYGQLPPPYLRTREGRPGLSWRVALIPYLEGGNLLTQFHLDEPWDSPHNRRLLDRMPDCYRATDAPPGETRTHMRVFVGGGALFDERRPVSLATIPDGASNTLMVVEAAEPVPWTKPEELEYDPNKPLPPLGHMDAGQFLGALAGGSVMTYRRTESEANLRALITRDGGEALPPGLGVPAPGPGPAGAFPDK
jgi:hypothetical protein